MAKKKEVTFKDVLTKLDKAFSDVVIINHGIFCTSDSGESDTIGYYFGLFTKEIHDLIKEKYPGYMIEIESIKDAKAALGTPNESDYIVESGESPTAKHYEEKFNQYYANVTSVDGWSPIPLTDEEIEKLVTNNEVVEAEFTGVPVPLQISKSLFPGITVKSIKQLSYHAVSDDEFDYLFIHQPTDFFDLYMMYTFMKE